MTNNERSTRNDKRSRFDQKPRRPGSRVPLGAVGLGLLVLVVTIAGAYIATRPGPAAGRGAADGSNPLHSAVVPEDGAVRLPVSDIADGSARYYTYNHDGRSIDFFVLRSADGAIRAALDACDVCYLARQGYSQDGDEMVCNNCGQRFPSSQIGVRRGGCNPSPLDGSIEGDTLIIRVEDLIAGATYF